MALPLPLPSSLVVAHRPPDSQGAPLPPSFVLSASGISANDLVRIVRGQWHLVVPSELRHRVERSRAVVDRALARGDIRYGLNTQLGFRRNEVIASEELHGHQASIVSTHQAGIGAPLSDEDARAAVVTRIIGMAQGGSGVSVEVFDLLVELLKRNVLPVLPDTGSVGATDLTQLAPLAALVTGRGLARCNGVLLPADVALSAVGLRPVTLAPKDALSIFSANAISIGVGALVLDSAAQTLALANTAAALSIEALRANLGPFSEAVVYQKTSVGQRKTGVQLRGLLQGSQLHRTTTHENVQDAISLRSIPSVHGAMFDHCDNARSALEVELNAASDNPVVIHEDDQLISNGNFSPTTMAISFEAVRLAIAHVAMLSERRLHKLFSARHTQRHDNRFDTRVPNLLVSAGASTLVAIKHLAQPITLSAPTLNQDVEDYASLALHAVTLSRQSVEQLERLLAIEILLAADTINASGSGNALGIGTARMLRTVNAVLDKTTPANASFIVDDLLTEVRGRL